MMHLENPTENLDIPADSVYNDTESGIGTGCIKCPAALLLFQKSPLTGRRIHIWHP